MENPLSISPRSSNSAFKKPEQTFQVELVTNPLLSPKISVDGNVVQVPGTLLLTPGIHVFAALGNVQDLIVSYTFDQWQVNGRKVSYNSTAPITITGPCTVTAQYMLYQSVVQAPALQKFPKPESGLPSNEPILILNNPPPPSNNQAYQER
jgi:hypothetical protein